MSVDQLSCVSPITASKNATIRKKCGEIVSSSANNNKNLGCKPKISFNIRNVSKGKFELAKGGPASGSNSVRRKLVTNGQTAFSLSKHENKFKHTELVTGTIPRGVITPTKRKIIDGGEVKSLICIYESELTKPTWRENIVTESPAKRQRCGRQGS